MTEIEYKYKQPKDTFFYKLILWILIGLFGFNFTRGIFSLIKDYNDKKLILFIVFYIIIIGILFVIIQILKMRKEYDMVDNNKSIIVNRKDRALLIRQSGLEISIKNEDIKETETYESYIAAYPLGYFKYIRIILKDQKCIIITGYTLPYLESDLFDVLKGIKNSRIRKIFSRIQITVANNMYKQ